MRMYYPYVRLLSNRKMLSIINKYVQWSWAEALRGALCMLPSIVLCLLGKPVYGLEIGICSIPLAMVGIQPERQDRLRLLFAVVMLSIVFGLGVVLPGVWWMDMISVFLVVYATVPLAVFTRIGLLAYLILLPSFVVAVSNHSSADSGLPISLLLFSSGVWIVIVNYLFPEKKEKKRKKASPRVPEIPKIHRLGLLFACAIVGTMYIGYYLEIKDPAWAAIAATLIIRPHDEMLKFRGIVRVMATTGGILLAFSMMPSAENNCVLGIYLFGIAVIIIAMRKIQWYLFPAGMALLLVLLYNKQEPSDFITVLNFGLIRNTIGSMVALYFGLCIPWMIGRVLAEFRKNN